jgi:hypothetical protein
MDDKTLVERARSDWDNLRVSKLWWAQTYGPDLFSTIEAQATRIEALEAALRECIDVMGPLAKYPNVNSWLIQAKQALEGSGNG